jgi:hypothetical protein
MAAVTDNFNRADGTGLGANWTFYATNGDFKIVSNQAQVVGSGTNSYDRYTGATFANDQYAQATMAVNPYNWGIVARMGAAAESYMVRGGDLISLELRIYLSITGGATSLLASTGITADVGDVIRIECEGTTIRAYKNGVLAGSVTDATYASGSPGMRGDFAGFDGFDDFGGGDLGGGGGSVLSRARFLPALGVS